MTMSCRKCGFSRDNYDHIFVLYHYGTTWLCDDCLPEPEKTLKMESDLAEKHGLWRKAY